MTPRPTRLVAVASLVAASALLPPLLGDAALAAGDHRAGGGATTVRISVKANGKEVPGAAADYPAVSANGRFVAFESFGRLLPRDSGSDLDVYVYDRTTRSLDLVSVKSGGVAGSGLEGERADISADGRYVTFSSESALVAGDTNGLHDIYRYDRRTDKVKRVSLTDADAQLTGVDDGSLVSGVSDNGRYVAWESRGAFVAGDGNGDNDVFVRDLVAGTTVRASLSDADAELPSGAEAGRDSQLALSGNGRYVAWQSYDQATAEGDYGFAVDTDVFVRDLQQERTVRASLKSNGLEASDSSNIVSTQPSISANGKLVAFVSDGAFVGADDNDRPDVYVRDTGAGKTTRVSLKSDGSEVESFPGTPNALPSISAGGRYVVWETTGGYGGPPEAGTSYRDVYRHDRVTHKTVIVSVRSNGRHPDAEHQLSAVSGDGRWVAFSSMGAFTKGDDPSDFDVFLRGPIRS